MSGKIPYTDSNSKQFMNANKDSEIDESPGVADKIFWYQQKIFQS